MAKGTLALLMYPKNIQEQENNMSGLGGGLGTTMNMSGFDIDLSNMDLKSLTPTIRSGQAVEVQTITITDVISEGPIEGLVGGASGVYLNDDSLNVREYGGTSYLNTGTKIVLENGSKEATITSLEKPLVIPSRDGIKLSGVSINSPRLFSIQSSFKKISVRAERVWNGTKNQKQIWALYDNDAGTDISTGTTGWWDNAWISNLKPSNTTRDRHFTHSGSSATNFIPVRLIKQNSSQDSADRVIHGILEEIPASNTFALNTYTKGVAFIPGSLAGSGAFTADATKYVFFEKDAMYDLFVDTTAVVSTINEATLSDRSYSSQFGPTSSSVNPSKLPYEQQVVLSKPWSGNQIMTFNSPPVNSDGTITIPTGIELKTGDRLIERKLVETTGSPINLVGQNGAVDPVMGCYAIKTSATTFKLANTLEKAFKGDALSISNITNLNTPSSTVPYSLEFSVQSFSDWGHDFVSDRNIKNLVQEASVTQKSPNSQIQFRAGHLQQEPFVGGGSVGSTSITNELNLEINQSTTSGGTQAPIVLTGTSSNGFGLNSDNIQDADELRISFKYPGGFKAVNTEGEDKDNYARYQIELQLQRGGLSTYGDKVLDIISDQKGSTSNSVVYEEVIDLTPFRPFSGFKVTIKRVTSTDKPSYIGLSPEYGHTMKRSEDWQNISRAQISTVTTVFKENFIYPLTAMSRISFSSKLYGNTPSRSYHCRGMLVKVPSNYVTREECGEAARYSRLVSTDANLNGVDTGIPQDWDGQFRLAYTNNPAWIFYDILTNNRYGLGSFVKSTDIDKYALYTIGKHCDEEVPDGKGGLEPRYTLNTYLTKSMDAYKVLKDMATNFMAMLYYMDGKILPVQDVEKSVTHNFSKANVLDGAFQYESTGSRTRSNQVQVIWNNPENHFRQEPLIVEDKRNIAEQGSVIAKEVVAFGCTSEGQATRYGRWKLWTSINQKEVVSFKTGKEGSYLVPGDVMVVQDVDRYATRLSGRVIKNVPTEGVGSLDASIVPLTTIQEPLFDSANVLATDRVLFSGNAVFPTPETFTNTNTSTYILFEFGFNSFSGPANGVTLQVTDKGGVPSFIIRAGDNSFIESAPEDMSITTDVTIPLQELSFFDGLSHKIEWFVDPSNGTLQVFIDGILIGDARNYNHPVTTYSLNSWYADTSTTEGKWGGYYGTVAHSTASAGQPRTLLNWPGQITSNLSIYEIGLSSGLSLASKVTSSQYVRIDAPPESGLSYTQGLLSVQHARSGAKYKGSLRSVDMPEMTVEFKVWLPGGNNETLLPWAETPQEIRKLLSMITLRTQSTSAGFSCPITLIAGVNRFPSNVILSTASLDGITISAALSDSIQNSVATIRISNLHLHDMVPLRNFPDHAAPPIIPKAWVKTNAGYQFVDIDTEERAVNAKRNPEGTEALPLTFYKDIITEQAEISTVNTSGTTPYITPKGSGSGSGRINGLTYIPRAGSVWTLMVPDQNNTSIIEGASSKKYKVLSIAQDKEEQYSVTGVEYFREKYDAIEEDFTTYVPQGVYKKEKVNDVVPPPLDASVQKIKARHQNTEDIKLFWKYAEDEGVNVTQPDGTVKSEKINNTWRGSSAVEITHSFENYPSPMTITSRAGRPEAVFKDISKGFHFIELRTFTDLGKRSVPIRLEIEMTEDLKYRTTGFFPGALHGGGSLSIGTEIV